jgi:SAM-dependent methyltransferase
MRQESQNWHSAYKNIRLVARRASSHKRKLARLGILSMLRDVKVLDVACGTGEALRILRDAGFTRLSGVDVTADADLAREPWLDLRAGDSKALPYKDGAFGAVLCMHSLHHLGTMEELRASLHEFVRVLEPGGLLALIDHYDSPQLRAAFWGLQKPWLTWPSAGLRAFREQHEEEWPYLYAYLDAWPGVRAMLATLPCRPILERRGAFFFYFAARKAMAGA